MSDLPERLRAVTKTLREIASEYANLKLTAGEEAMTWKLGVTVDDGEAALWCDQDGCLLDGHNSEILSRDEIGSFTIAELLSTVIDHIQRNQERQDDL